MPFLHHRISGLFPLMVFTLCACVRPAPNTNNYQLDTKAPGVQFVTATASRPAATPAFQLQPTRIPGSPILSPTPDAVHLQPEALAGPESYIVQNGDTLGAIAARYGLSLERLLAENGLSDPNTISVGQILTIPLPTSFGEGSSFKIIPDSELVNGPMSILLDTGTYVDAGGGYLASYSQIVDGELLSGSEIVLLVARNYSVNPRLLLALLEYRSGWVTDPHPPSAGTETPIGIQDGWHDGLYRQLTWTANALNQGYYLWRSGSVREWTLQDGTAVPVNPVINAGTAAVQSFFAGLDGQVDWSLDVSEAGFITTYHAMFGSPFDLAIEPIVPTALFQPSMQLPFERGEIWAFTGGPHGGWDLGSAWAALDFAPAGMEGCLQSAAWVVAVADGLVVRSDHGIVIQDLDGDGYEQTGWNVLYLHIESPMRVPLGVYLRAGERIGHPSCEGGVAAATHLHLARKLNGEWIPADATVPFNLDEWISSGTGVEYDGFLRRSNLSVEAYNGTLPINQIQR